LPVAQSNARRIAGGRAGARGAEAGFTLIEVLVALVLFALIGAAGLAVLDQVLRVQRQTEGRLERLAGIQRAMHLVGTDFMQASGGSLSFADGAVALRRPGETGALALRYDLDGTTLRRSLSGPLSQSPAQQALLAGVSGLGWRFYAPQVGWVADWPPDEDEPPANPAAVALELTLEGPGLAGELRRVAILPSEAER